VSKKVSVVIPVFNIDTFVEKCLLSLENQTYKDLEILIVDDGSTDATVTIIKEFVERDSRFKLFKISHHGAASARKIGIQNSSGPFITFVDGDDFLEPEAIMIMMEEMTKNNCDIVIAKHRKIYVDNSHSIFQNDYPFQLIDHVGFADFINSNKDYTLWGKIFKLELFNDIIFHEGIPIGEDALVLNQVILKARLIKAINHIIYNYVLHENSISHKLYSKISSQLLYIKGSLDNLFIYEKEKQYDEKYRLFRDLMKYSKYYLMMNAEEKKIYHGIWNTYYDKKTTSKLLNGNNIEKFTYFFSHISPRIYSFFNLGQVYGNLLINRCKSKAMHTFDFINFRN
jgi:glycosyltransferase involved in cell wall biosynthesis